MTETIIDLLTENSVSVITKRYAEINGTTYLIGTYRKAYDNSPTGRQMIEDELSATDSAAIMAKWGDEATVDDPQTSAEESGVLDEST